MINKNQHYVPKFYFRLFSNNGVTICTYNLLNNIFIEHATINGQCSKSYFYSKKTEIEKTFSWLESLANRKIKSIIENKSLNQLTEEEKFHLKSHILFQYGRTKSIKDKEEDIANHLFDLLKPKIYADAKKAGEDISWESIKDTKIKLNSSDILFAGMMSGILLVDLNICLVENKSNTDFIFSDNPVVLFNSFFNEKHFGGTTGLASTGLQIFYPICSRLMIFIYDPNFYSVCDSVKIYDENDVQRLNGLQILNCDNNIYFGKYAEKEKIRLRVKQIKFKRPVNKNTYQIVDRKFNEDGTFSELEMTSSSKIKYNLEKLSFLKHKKNSSPYGVRNKEIVDMNRKVMDAVYTGKIKSMDDLSHFLKTLKK